MYLPAGCEYYRAHDEQEPEISVLAEQLAFDHGETYDGYLATDPDRRYFFGSDGEGVVAVRRKGRYLYVTGGLLAPRDRRECLLDEFLDFVKGNRWHVTFMNVPRNEARLFRNRGLQISKFGEEPLIQLSEVQWRGKAYEWLRRQENGCKRQGVEIREIDPNPFDPYYCDKIVPRLLEISQTHIAQTLHQRELEFFVGRFRPLQMGRRRLFVAERDAKIMAFIVCNPALSGNLWAIEIYRRSADAVRGVIPFAMLQAMRQLQQEGVPYVSLSLVPCLRCEQAVTGDSWIARPTAVFCWKHLNWLFDFRGIYHFKSRFRPDYREMYLAAAPRITVGSMLAMGRMFGVFSASPGRTWTRLRRQMRKAPSRKTLATPGYRPDRVIRDLRIPSCKSSSYALTDQEHRGGDVTAAAASVR